MKSKLQNEFASTWDEMQTIEKVGLVIILGLILLLPFM